MVSFLNEFWQRFGGAVNSLVVLSIAGAWVMIGNVVMSAHDNEIAIAQTEKNSARRAAESRNRDGSIRENQKKFTSSIKEMSETQVELKTNQKHIQDDIKKLDGKLDQILRAVR